MAASNAAGKQPDDSDSSAAERLAADATTPERAGADGSMLVPLVTANGTADLRIPAPRKWRSVAKNALFNQDNPLIWAVRTLSPEDYLKFVELDPDGDELDQFWREWGRLTGEALGDFLASRS